MKIISGITIADLKALKELLPPLQGEKWHSYLSRALEHGLVTLGEGCRLMDTYGLSAFQKEVDI